MVMLLVGFATAIWIVRREEDASGRNGDRMVDLGIIMLCSGVMGARLLSVVADGHFHDFVNLCVDPRQVPALDEKVHFCTESAQCGYDYLCDTARNKCYPPKDCLAAFKFWQGGLAFYGGFVLSVPLGLWYARKKQLGIWRVADMTAPVIALGLFFGRMGCFLNGCCYGEPTDAAWGVKFPGIAHERHPTQLYEAAGALAIFLFLYFVVRPRKRRHGEVFAWLLAVYGTLRFGLEFLRDDERGALLGLSTSQLIGIPLVVWGVVMLARGHAANRRPDPAVRT
jgi:phosphatidylglycerol:prolipoprotein diacylglycerol transferase